MHNKLHCRDGFKQKRSLRIVPEGGSLFNGRKCAAPDATLKRKDARDLKEAPPIILHRKTWGDDWTTQSGQTEGEGSGVHGRTSFLGGRRRLRTMSRRGKASLRLEGRGRKPALANFLIRQGIWGNSEQTKYKNQGHEALSFPWGEGPPTGESSSLIL